MTLDGAIKELDDSLDESIPTIRRDRRDAIQLGIEALKEIQAARLTGALPNDNRLPSETEGKEI